MKTIKEEEQSPQPKPRKKLEYAKIESLTIFGEVTLFLNLNFLQPKGESKNILSETPQNQTPKSY